MTRRLVLIACFVPLLCWCCSRMSEPLFPSKLGMHGLQARRLEGTLPLADTRQLLVAIRVSSCRVLTPASSRLRCTAPRALTQASSPLQVTWLPSKGSVDPGGLTWMQNFGSGTGLTSLFPSFCAFVSLASSKLGARISARQTLMPTTSWRC